MIASTGSDNGGLRSILLAVILAFSFASASCNNHVSASRAEVSPDAVMVAVRTYGQGANTSLLRPPATKPDEAEEIYQSHIATLLAQGDFAELEKIATENRTGKGRLIGGIWKQYAFYDGVSLPTSSADSDYQFVLQGLQKWQTAYPKSATVRIATAKFYLKYAWVARGDGFANTVSDSQWSLFNNRISQAESALVEASTLKDRDAAWYGAMLQVAEGQGWPKEQTRELFDRGAEFEPMYYHTYRYYAAYLEPQWFGQPGDIQALAEETYKKFPGPDGAWLYFEIASVNACYCDPAQTNLGKMSFPKMLQGWNTIREQYGVSNLKANRFAMMALTFQDQPSGKEAFSYITGRNAKVWPDAAEYEYAKAWATQ